MGKQQQQRKQRDNYFKQQIKRLGPNFLECKTSEELAYDSMRIFRDIASGNIDVNTEAVYLTNPKLLPICTTVAHSKVFYYQTLAIGLDMLNNNYSAMVGVIPKETYDVYNHVTNCLKAWQLIENACNYLRISPDYKGVVLTLVSNLKPLRRNI